MNGTCLYLCNEEFYDPGDGSCAPCTVVDECEARLFLNGRCTQDSTPTCVPCLDIPPNAYAVGDDCAWMCNDNRYRDLTGTMCVPCLTECLQGEYLLGECTQYTGPECLPCLNAPADARYNATAAAGRRSVTLCAWLADTTHPGRTSVWSALLRPTVLQGRL